MSIYRGMQRVKNKQRVNIESGRYREWRQGLDRYGGSDKYRGSRSFEVTLAERTRRIERANIYV